MTIPEKFLKHLQDLPESLQAEVLDFVEYLELKDRKNQESRRDGLVNSFFDLSHAWDGR